MAIVFDNNTNGAVSSWSFNHTIGGGSNRILVAFFHSSASDSSGATPPSCTFNGVSATGTQYSGTDKWGNGYVITLFYWLEADLPTAGTYTVQATDPGPEWNYIGVSLSFEGADQVTPVVVIDNSIVGNDGASSVTLTTVATDSIIIESSGFYSGINSTITPLSGQTSLGTVNQNSQGSMAYGYGTEATAQAYNRRWDFNQNEYAWQAIALAFAPAGGIPPVASKANMLAHNF